jgi:DNA-binding transcriptional ArsR family regulator
MGEHDAEEARTDEVLLALANATRRRILDIVAAAPGCTVGEVAEHFTISRVGVLKHINVLEEAGMLVSNKSGRERVLRFDPVPIRLILDRWSDRYRDFWADRLVRLKVAVEKAKQS